jgi:transcriptional regulator with XRE-family HTH domain
MSGIFADGSFLNLPNVLSYIYTMSILLDLRENLNLTQEELAKKARVSVRTIQRIEAGTKPKGYTLEALSNALGVSKEVLSDGVIKTNQSNKQLIKYINLSSILFMIIPLGSIILPFIIMKWKKEINDITKQIVSIQILWTLTFVIVTVLVAFMIKWFSLSKEMVPLAMIILIISNLYIIIRNTLEIEKNDKLHISLNFSFL